MSGAGVHPLAAVALIGGLLAVGVYLVAVLDGVFGSVIAGRAVRPGALLAGPARRAALLALSSPGDTERPDTQAWALAPALLTGLAAVALATVPLSPTLSIADPSTGFVVFSAAIAFVMIAVFLHGWSPNSPWPLHGAYRYAAQALSFQIPFLLAMLATTLPAESLQIGEIVRAQEPMWNVVRQPLGLPLYLVVGLGVSFWGPLNLSDAADLAGGTTAEVGGVPALLWQIARAAMLVAVAAMGAAAFLGGWWGPWQPGIGWMIAKTLLLLALLVSSRHLIARVRLERFVIVCWVALIPLALVNIFVSGAWLL
ncbi:NADH-quinone oxidoreductase subunit H [Nitriliruptoraceae bacterium ZYF776]|nr:NADH-quinone oxidoreductase subunit H [Profundirhabdus halotolerans]